VPDVNRICNKCGKTVKFHFGQRITTSYELAWSGGFSCAVCFNSEEVDGIGKIDKELRGIIINEEGIWGLNIVLCGSELTKALSILRKLQNLTMDDLKVMKNLAPGTICNGTRIEMMRLQKVLLNKSIKSEVKRVK